MTIMFAWIANPSAGHAAMASTRTFMQLTAVVVILPSSTGQEACLKSLQGIGALDRRDNFLLHTGQGV